MSSSNLSGVGMTSLRTRQRLIDYLRTRGIHDEAVLETMLQVPRHLFVRPGEQHRAYDDTALKIGQGQTISQPYIVARMTELARVSDPRVKKVLDVGTGCGYQAAILTQLCDWVFTIERIPELQRPARDRLEKIGYRNISYKMGDGYQGWPQKAPFDAIIVAAAPHSVPAALVEQLAVGGRMVIPVGPEHAQTLEIIERTESGYTQTTADAVRFVPLV